MGNISPSRPKSSLQLTGSSSYLALFPRALFSFFSSQLLSPRAKVLVFGRPNHVTLVGALGSSRSKSNIILYPFASSSFMYVPFLFCSNTISLQMDLTISCFSLSLLFFIISLQIHFLVPASGYFEPFQECVPYPCGDQEISYPFKHNERPNHCGFPGYELGCDGDNLTLSMESLKYWVIHIDWSTHILEVARTDLWDDICPETHVNTTLNCSLFNYASTYSNSTLFYDCDSSTSLQPYYRFYCPWSGYGYFAPNATIENQLHELCKISVPVPFSHIEALGLPPPPKDSNDSATISEFLKKGFEITWIADTSQCENCNKSGGRCGYDWIRHQFNCFCPDGAHSPTCHGKRVSGSFPSSMYAYSHLVCGFQLAKAVQLDGLLGIPIPLLVNWKTTAHAPES